MERRDFIRILALGTIAGNSWFNEGCTRLIFPSAQELLFDYEERYQDKLLDPKEHSLKRDWLSKISQALVERTNHLGKSEDLIANFSFAYSDDEYKHLTRQLPGFEDEDLLDRSNAATVMQDDGASGTVMHVTKLKQVLINTTFQPWRVVGIMCAHEMGHRTIKKPKKLETPIFIQGMNALMAVDRIQGLKLRGYDANNPQRPLNFLALLDEVPAELQARKTYHGGYRTPEEPVRTAVSLLSRMERLCVRLRIPIDEIITYQRNNDPFGLFEKIATNVNLKADDNERTVYSINLILNALNNNWIEVDKFLANPQNSIYPAITPPQ